METTMAPPETLLLVKLSVIFNNNKMTEEA
jgi:hypothetical protein